MKLDLPLCRCAPSGIKGALALLKNRAATLVCGALSLVEGAVMQERTQLQFKLLGREAQIASLRRLALGGTRVEDIAARTGLSAEVIRSCLGPDYIEPASASAVRYWRRSRLGLSQAFTQ